jgi:hypothetical protein
MHPLRNSGSICTTGITVQGSTTALRDDHFVFVSVFCPSMPVTIFCILVSFKDGMSPNPSWLAFGDGAAQGHVSRGPVHDLLVGAVHNV